MARDKLRGHASREDAAVLVRFFKTGPGEYGEGDRFLGVRAPATRRVAREFRELPLPAVQELLESPWHEERLLALLIMIEQFRRGSDDRQREVYEMYLANTCHINNWDLIDISAAHIVGAYLAHRSRRALHKLARSTDLWERRIAIVSTLHFIRRGELGETLALAGTLLHDPEDLIHKAVGWMLREVGKRDLAAEEAFLKPHYHTMPRTMLRYAIEHFPEPLRLAYLKGKVRQSTPYEHRDRLSCGAKLSRRQNAANPVRSRSAAGPQSGGSHPGKGKKKAAPTAKQAL